MAASSVPDTNVLLHLFRFMPKQRKEVIAAFESFGKRLWLPHQVAKEFQDGWRSADSENRRLYAKLKEDLAEKRREIENLIKGSSRFDPWPKGSPMLQVAGFFESLSAEVDSATAKLPDANAVFDAVTGLFDGKVSEQPKKTDLEARRKEADRRKQDKVPPGYRDKRPGDYLIWAELKEKAKTAKLPVLFITADVKEDWWLRHGGKTVGPRPELRDEFSAETGQMFYAYEADRFLSLVAERNKNLVSDDTVLEMKRIQNRRLVAASSLRIRSKLRELLEDIVLKEGASQEGLLAYAANIAVVLDLIEPTIVARAAGKETGDDPEALKKHADDLKSDALNDVIYFDDSEVGAHNVAMFDKLIDLLRDTEYRNELEHILNRLAATRELRERIEETRQTLDKQQPGAP
ncbi:MAG: hypothetical protein E5V92_01905 [Mesorhizobium sp.]|uniref:PIN-like domain-containing protein n=1 Tax=unclassified Mesorhizobium TaxID=325217 RepID=UPI000F756D80|nr:MULTISPECIES: PIN-like domain-containing protein [unclassified Mesorhizobium]AZO75031.1 hypothetical protein EJ067_30555 [Mesorhizobium sp. M1D.F.Ca.ET.043.01.1.1]RWA96098.1 MAG: hypothetical protein EOQ32_00320 [Mesorhizobium sp.]TJW90378.1 MAG: hypothetical protein E5V92_01905 [Mesorhizobium sp.]